MTATAALDALRTSPYLPLRSLQCHVRRGVITIQGSVPTYYLKQLAQTLVLQIDSSRRIENQIEVVPPGEFRTLAAAWLRRHGLHVEEAANGQEALEST
ncbi:MAG: BON domain-containing protein [Planctomycetes bacterium]|nr:BON domain-containing protein [Planctomycetota bacterium]